MLNDRVTTHEFGSKRMERKEIRQTNDTTTTHERQRRKMRNAHSYTTFAVILLGVCPLRTAAQRQHLQKANGNECQEIGNWKIWPATKTNEDEPARKQRNRYVEKQTITIASLFT